MNDVAVKKKFLEESQPADEPIMPEAAASDVKSTSSECSTARSGKHNTSQAVRVKLEPQLGEQTEKKPQDYSNNTYSYIESAFSESQSAIQVMVRVKLEPIELTYPSDTNENTLSNILEYAQAFTETVGVASSTEAPNVMNSSNGALPVIKTVSSINATARVKSEPVIPEIIPDDFFDDLLDNVDQLTAELSPQPIDGVQPEQDIINNALNKATPCERVRIKAEPLSLGQINEFSAGDEQDNIPTPPTSPRRLGIEEVISSSFPADAQIRVKIEVNQEGASDCNEETIPENFFDDLLDDCVAPRVEHIENRNQDIKSRHSSSRKRGRSRNKNLCSIETPQFNTNYGNIPKVPPSPPAFSQAALTSSAHVEAVPNNVTFFPKPIMVKSEFSENFEDMPFHADENKIEDMNLDCLPVRSLSKRRASDAADAFSGFKKIKLEKLASEPKKPVILTSAMKRRKENETDSWETF